MFSGTQDEDFLQSPKQLPKALEKTPGKNLGSIFFEGKNQWFSGVFFSKTNGFPVFFPGLLFDQSRRQRVFQPRHMRWLWSLRQTRTRQRTYLVDVTAPRFRGRRWRAAVTWRWSKVRTAVAFGEAKQPTVWSF